MPQWTEDDVREGLRALVPDLPAPADRLARVSALAARRRRAHLAAPVLTAVAVAAVIAIGQPLGSPSPRPNTLAAPAVNTPSPYTALVGQNWALDYYRSGDGSAPVEGPAVDVRGVVLLRITTTGTFILDYPCTHSSGTIDISANTVSFRDVVSLMASCPVGAVDVPLDRSMERLLADTADWSLSEGHLMVTASDGTVFQFIAEGKPAAVSPAAMAAVDDLANRVQILITEKRLTGFSTSRVDYATNTVYVRWVGAVPTEITDLQSGVEEAFGGVHVTLSIATGTYTEQQMDTAAERVMKAFGDRTKQPFWIISAGRTSDGSGIEVNIAPPGTYGTPKLTQAQLSDVSRTIAAKAAPVSVVRLGFKDPGVATIGKLVPSPYSAPTRQ